MVRKYKTNAWVTAGLMLLASVPALAAGLGRLTVTSSLGQPFRGEIELLAVDKKDLGAIRATLASQEAFREARIERSPVLSAMRFSVEQKKSGEPYLKVTSTKSVDEPFLDMLIELDWPSGRLVREYTVLLDPPGYSEPQEAVAPVELPVAAPVSAARPEMVAQPEVAKALEMPAAVKPEAKASIPPAKKPLVKAVGKEEIAAAKPAGETYGPVKKGENLSGIAVALKSEGISLEQMLVALFKSNKQAFDGDNMNRLKAGQILRVPEAGQIEAVEKGAAVTEVKAHSVDWHAYRQKLAAAVADAKPATEDAARQVVSGKITAAVEDKAALAKEPAKDVLKLSRSEGLGGAKPAAGAGGGKELQTMKEQIQAMQEESTAKEKAIKEANQRIADLEKNIKEMQKLLELRNQNLADLQKQAAADKAAPAAAAEQKAVPAPAGAEDAAAKAEVPKPAPPEAVQPEISLLDELMGNPLYLGGGAAAALLLALLGVRVAAARRRKAAGLAGSLKASGELQESAFLGGAGGARIDTSDTSFLTDFSQSGLGAIGTNEVDPIAEAEVYMAYGRDAQAEEILKEALTKDPYRHEIRLKLLEIHAGRKNANAFGFVAEELHAALAGQASPIWDKAAAMGRALDPDNPLYVEKTPAAAEPSFDAAMVAAGVTAGLAAAAEGAGAEVSPEMPEEAAAEAEQMQAEAEAEAEPAATDLGFEFDLGAQAEAAPETAEAPPEVAEEAVEPEQEVLMEFDLGALTEAAPEAAETIPEPEKTVEPQEAAMEPDLGELAEAEPVAEETPEPTEQQEVLMEFDLGTLPEAAPETAEAMPAPEEKAEPQEAAIKPDLGVMPEAGPVAEETPEPAGEMAEPRETETEFDLGALTEAAETMPESEEMAEPQAEAEPVAEETPEQVVEETAEPEAEAKFDLGALPEAAPEEAGGVVEEASAAEPAPVEVSISADAWKDEVMSLEFGSGVSAAPAEAPAPEDEMAEIGGEEETTVLDLPEFAASAETPFAEGETEAIELAPSPVEESPLDFDFNLAAEEEAQAPSKAKGAPAPTLDLSGISLEMDELPSPKAASPEQPVEDFGSQEVSTKLDLAKAYMDMGDKEGAREILQEVIDEGSAEQQEEGRKLLAEL